MSQWRELSLSVTPKMHLLEDHLLKQISLFGWYSGLYNEQGGEASHSLSKKKGAVYGKYYAIVKIGNSHNCITLSGVM